MYTSGHKHDLDTFQLVESTYCMYTARFEAAPYLPSVTVAILQPEIVRLQQTQVLAHHVEQHLSGPFQLRRKRQS